jgi:hypothetical protein
MTWIVGREEGGVETETFVRARYDIGVPGEILSSGGNGVHGRLVLEIEHLDSRLLVS